MPAASHITIRKRVVFLFLFIAVIMSGLMGRLIYLQFYKSAWLAENAVDQRIREIPVEAKRGVIYDRNGRELAVSVNTESIYVIPAEIQNPEETAAALAAILPLKEDAIRKKIKKRQAFAWLERRVDSEIALKVQQLNLPGIGITQESQRYYPNDNLAAHILGFTGIDSQGLDGVELTFDSYLKGRSGSIVIEYDARGREIPETTHRFVPPLSGHSIYLTIDLVIQQIVERELDQVMKETQAKSATIIAIDPRDGGILALASKPDYNPNNFGDYSPKLWRNVAVANVYEPGSTFKIITTAAALSEKAVTRDEKFFDPGSVEVQGRNIRCWKAGGHGHQTFTEVVQNSCNVGFVNVGLRMGIDPFYKYIDAFGFGKVTDIDLPGEAKGLVINQSQVKPINLATMSIGQSIAVTPIQLVTAAAAVANDGVLLRPQILREVRDKDNNVIRPFQPDVLKKILEANVAAELKGVLEKVVELGSGRNAYIEGFGIAGKTGTAQKAGPGGYQAGKYVASFVGFAPADNPQVAMLVIIDEPVGLYYGGQIAAPVFGKVIKDILQYLKVAPKATATENGQAKEEHIIVSDVINFTVEEAAAELKKQGLSVRIEETGPRVADQIPKPGSRMPPGTEVLIYTLTSRYGGGEITVPDLTGYSFKEASESLANLGLTIEPVGSAGKIVKQDPGPGGKVSPGSGIRIYLEETQEF